jgi:hypothetical protein
MATRLTDASFHLRHYAKDNITIQTYMAFVNMLVASVMLFGLLGLASAQFPPKPEGTTVLKSRFHENVTISYKEVSILQQKLEINRVEPANLSVISRVSARLLRV